MIGALIRTAVVRSARRPIVLPVTRTSIRRSGHDHGEWSYRSGVTPDPWDVRLADAIMTLTWWWFFYHIITQPEHITVLHVKSLEADLAGSPVTGAVLIHIRKCTKLKKLTFSSVPSDDSVSEMSLLETIKCFHELTWLELSGVSALTDSVLAVIARQNKLLTVVKVKDCVNVGDDGLEALAENCNSLKSVDLSSTQITSRSVTALANRPCSRTLEEFLANRCFKLGAEVVTTLTKEFPALRILTLRDCHEILFGEVPVVLAVAEATEGTEYSSSETEVVDYLLGRKP
ncbi:hypothetical protein HPB50_005951 [Hyalomma asiaticum]|uniref:Uncharacterized protein n=1 Tax=Hyalomma asiaticum TaxID=266040 RepID=A0ACB7RPL7_HYAAI|nr:hypothetical protein HPB50_005951 [Hyalomma asiaticum]